jgi:hypothetical protein
VRRRVDGGAAKGANGEAARGNLTMIQRLKMRLVALVAALVATSAQAAPQRTPETGNPAVVVDVPDGWVLQRLSAITLNVLTPARNGLISITIETTPPGADLNLFRDNVFKSANCTSLNRADPHPLGAGHPDPARRHPHPGAQPHLPAGRHRRRRAGGGEGARHHPLRGRALSEGGRERSGLFRVDAC